MADIYDTRWLSCKDHGLEHEYTEWVFDYEHHCKHRGCLNCWYSHCSALPGFTLKDALTVSRVEIK